MRSKTTLAGAVIALCFISTCVLVYMGKTSFNESSPVLLGIFALVGGWGLKNAKDDKQ